MPPGRDFRLAAREIAEPQLRSLQIGENADRPPGVGFDLANFGESGAVLVVGAVAEIEPEDIDPGVEQRAQALAAGARRPDRREGLGAAQPPQRPVAAALAVGLPASGQAAGWLGSQCTLSLSEQSTSGR